MAIYYRHLFSLRGEITDSEGIVYSALVYRALENPEYFNQDGELDIEAVKAFIRDGYEELGIECIDLPGINKSKLARDTGLPRQTVIRLIDNLQQKHIMDSDFIICPVELLEGGYMELPPDTSLTGQQLVFYALLRDRSRKYGGIIDTWAYRLAEIFGTTKGNIYYLLSVLERKGYLERLPDNRLKIK